MYCNYKNHSYNVITILAVQGEVLGLWVLSLGLRLSSAGCPSNPQAAKTTAAAPLHEAFAEFRFGFGVWGLGFGPRSMAHRDSGPG